MTVPRILSLRPAAPPRRLILLEHPLVLAHVRNVPRAKIAQSGIISLRLMVFERPQKRPVLNDGVVDLTSQKCAAVIHSCLRFFPTVQERDRRAVIVANRLAAVHLNKRNLCPKKLASTGV